MNIVESRITKVFQELLSSDDLNLGLTLQEFSSGYVYRVATGLRNKAAVESLELFEPDDPLYGYGVYAHIAVEQFDDGALLYLSPHIIATAEMWLIRAALGLSVPPWEGTEKDVQSFYTRRSKLFKKLQSPDLIERLANLRIVVSEGKLQPDLTQGIVRVRLSEAIDKNRPSGDNNHAATE